MLERMRTTLSIAVVGACCASVASCNYGVPGAAPTAPTTSTTTTSGSTSTPAPSPSPPTTPSTGLTYVKDVQPILAADCVRCHGPSRQDAGYNLSTYAGVMRAVTPGSANSRLVTATQPHGVMYLEFSGSESTKSGIIRDWVVTWKAQQQ